MTQNKKNGCKSSNNKALVKEEYSREEKERIARYKKRSEEKPPKFKSRKTASGKPMIEVQENHKKLIVVKMMEALGTPDTELQSFLFDQAIQTFKGCVSVEGFNYDGLETFANNTIALLRGIAPKDEVEAMLAIQMIGVHNMAMTIMGRTMITDQTFEGRQAGVNQATKMLRTFTSQMEALKKYRSKGEQKVTVEHVHVNKGGQAIVGNVTQEGGGNENEKCG